MMPMFDQSNTTPDVKAAAKKFLIASALSLIVLAIILHALIPYIEQKKLSGFMLYIVALIPAIPTLLTVPTWIGFYKAFDELHQKVVLETIVITLIIIGPVMFSYAIIDALLPSLLKLSLLVILAIFNMIFGLVFAGLLLKRNAV